MRARSIALALAILAPACEHGITLRGQVEVSAEVQRRFSREAPGILWFRADFGGNTVGEQLLAVLCEPSAAALQVPLYHDQFGCAAEGTASFKLTRLAPADRDRLPCGIRKEDLGALINRRLLTAPDSLQEVVASATVPIFRGKGGGCTNGDETLGVTMMSQP